MARTKETKMFPEQQEKMTQEVMASLQPSTYGKDYAQKHSSFFEEVENSDLEVVTENVAATTSNMEDELTNEVQSPPNPQKRISGKQWMIEAKPSPPVSFSPAVQETFSFLLFLP